MHSLSLSRGSCLVAILVCLVFLPGRAAAFGAGNIPSIAQVEGYNWRHGDIEDMLSTVAFLRGKKWSSMMIKRTYFGNWLRDYSQAIDVGSLKGVNAATIRILVWVLSFMSFGYATDEFEVTEERLGVYRPEEHIDNPLGYADGEDARKYDARLRGPVETVEVEIDRRTGMKNYIANESGQWATSAGYLRFSLARSIHYGRLYNHGSQPGREADLCEALRCLGQALHCLEDFSAHSNYCELALRELGYLTVFPHCGVSSEITLGNKRVFPLVTGTFGAVDFLHTVIGEATDHFTQSEVDEIDIAMKNAERSRMVQEHSDFISLVSKLPGVGDTLAGEARDLKATSEVRRRENEALGGAGESKASFPGMDPNFDPIDTARKIYPILQFRDRIVKAINRGIAQVPGLEKLIDHISETLTAFVLGLLAPFVRPVIDQVTKALKDGASGVISASSRSQLEPWTDPRCTDPTHSMLSKDHFTNVLNSCAGRVATTVLQYTVPRALFAWDNPNVPVDEVVNDVLQSFHHPAIRNPEIEIQRTMFETVRTWEMNHPRRHDLASILSSASVRQGGNQILNQQAESGGHHVHNAWQDLAHVGHSRVTESLWSKVQQRDLNSMRGGDQDVEGDGSQPGPNIRGGYSAPSPQPYHGWPRQAHQGFGPPPAQAHGDPGYGYDPGTQQSYGQQGYASYPPRQDYGPPHHQRGYGPPPPGQGYAGSYWRQ